MRQDLHQTDGRCSDHTFLLTTSVRHLRARSSPHHLLTHPPFTMYDSHPPFTMYDSHPPFTMYDSHPTPLSAHVAHSSAMTQARDSDWPTAHNFCRRSHRSASASPPSHCSSSAVAGSTRAVQDSGARGVDKSAKSSAPALARSPHYPAHSGILLAAWAANSGSSTEAIGRSCRNERAKRCWWEWMSARWRSVSAHSIRSRCEERGIRS
jgi:hypothetical protein